MKQRKRRTLHAPRLTLLAATLFLTSCVERRFVVYTDPPGAVVLRNGVPLSSSPADEYFEYYGKYHFTLIAEGYQTLQVDQKIVAPWYEFPGLDFISENLVPWKIVDRREFSYRLEPRTIPDTNKLLTDGQNLRNRGIALGGGSALPQPGDPAILPPPRTLPQSGTNPAPPAGPAQPPSTVPLQPSPTPLDATSPTMPPAAPLTNGTTLSPPAATPQPPAGNPQG